MASSASTCVLTNARLRAAHARARADLLAERDAAGHWVGELSSSALATATAVSALTLVARQRRLQQRWDDTAAVLENTRSLEGDPFQLHVERGLRWLADRQNADGGWGDTEISHSNIACSMLVVAAFHLNGVPTEHQDLLERAKRYIEYKGGVAGLRKRYGRDKTFAAPILANCALAGLHPWRDVPALPFEAACVPQRFYRFLRLPVVSYAIPALVAIGQARYHHAPPLNPLTRWARRWAVEPSLRVLERMQPASGGFLEATPLTSFVVMSLASCGRAEHPVARSGVEFLLRSRRPDGGWPIDTDLATWNTTLALNALAAAPAEDPWSSALSDAEAHGLASWLLRCQCREPHPFTGAAPGGFGWSNLSGAVPDGDDTPGALLALRGLREWPAIDDAQRQEITEAARRATRWLLDLQNSDGGWPTFCRGWSKLPFDRSGADLTAHALRALRLWRGEFEYRWQQDIDRATERGLKYLTRAQNGDGAFTPLWFGNQDQVAEENPVYGSAKVLAAYRDLNRLDDAEAQRALAWLRAAQNDDGGWWGGSRKERQLANAEGLVQNGQGSAGRPLGSSTVEETALAVEALLADAHAPASRAACRAGLAWLVDAVERGEHKRASPIGFYFAKLWYFEKLYPYIFAVAALGRALRFDWDDADAAAEH